MNESLVKKKAKISKNCNQCEYASSRTGDLRDHLKTHSGEKSNKCSQCDFASSHASVFKDTFENAQWGKVK